LRAEGFFCSLDVLYGGLGIGKLQIFIKKKLFFSVVIFFTFWSSKPWIQIVIHSKMLDLDLDPDQMNSDLKHWSHKYKFKKIVFPSTLAARPVIRGVVG